MTQSIHSHGAMAAPSRQAIATPNLDQVIRDLRKSKTGADGKAPDLSSFRVVSKYLYIGQGLKLKAPEAPVQSQRSSEGGTRTAALIDKDCRALELPSLGSGLVAAMRMKGETLFPQLERAAAWVRVAKELSDSPELLSMADHNQAKLKGRIAEAATALASQDLHVGEFLAAGEAVVSRMLSNPSETAIYIVSEAVQTLRKTKTPPETKAAAPLEADAPEPGQFESKAERKSGSAARTYPQPNRVSLHPSPSHPHKAPPVRPIGQSSGSSVTQPPGNGPSLSSSVPPGVAPGIRPGLSTSPAEGVRPAVTVSTGPAPTVNASSEQPGSTQARAEELIHKGSRHFGVQNDAEIQRLAQLAVRDAQRRGCTVEDSARLALASANSMNPKAILTPAAMNQYSPAAMAPFVQALVELRKGQLTGAPSESAS